MLRSHDYSLTRKQFNFKKPKEKWLTQLRIDGAEELSKLK